MRAVRCSWVDAQRRATELDAAERGDQERLGNMVCVNKSTVSTWAAARDLIKVTRGKVDLSQLSIFQPTHGRELMRHFRKQHGKDWRKWPGDVVDVLVDWVERAEAEKLTVQQLRIALVSPSGPSASDPRIVENLEDLIRAEETFGTIYADPPWPYQNQATRASTSDHYQTPGLDWICSLPIASIAAPQSHLHLWTTNAFLPDAFRVVEAWGFDYKSVFVWCKPQIGLGNYWRVAHEFLLLGVRGGCPFRDRELKSWGIFDRAAHSVKPAEVRRLVERASPGPYLELFGRRLIERWSVWGDHRFEPDLFTTELVS